MTELVIAGLGVWSPAFANWEEFSKGVNTGAWRSNTSLQPELIPARERRRAPQSVKLAVEVMSQACSMTALDPGGIATVFSSAMGDMQITDYLCRTLSTEPRLVSPTRFHNSVHNATTGYWSITSQSHAATNAVSAFAYTAPTAFLEAAIQALEDAIPVLLVNQEMAAPPALHDICPSDQPFSSAILLVRSGDCANPLATIEFRISMETVDWPELPAGLRQLLKGNPGARLLPLLCAIAARNFTDKTAPTSMKFPLTPGSCLDLSVLAGPGMHQIS